MGLTGSEKRGAQGHVVDLSNQLVSVAVGDGTRMGAKVPSYLTDVDGRMVMVTTGLVSIGSVVPGWPTDSTGALVTVAAPDGTPFGSKIPGFLTDAQGRVVTGLGPVVSMLGGLPRNAAGALVKV